MVVIHPFDSVFKIHMFTQKIVACSIVLILMISCTVTITFKYVWNELGNNLCLPFLNIKGPNVGVRLLVWLVGILQTLSSIAIIICYIIIVINVRRSTRKFKRNSSFKTSLAPSIIRAIMYSNIIGWLPTNAFFITILYSSKYPLSLYLLVTVLVLPLNSLINPCIFLMLNRKKHSFIKMK